MSRLRQALARHHARRYRALYRTDVHRALRHYDRMIALLPKESSR